MLLFPVSSLKTLQRGRKKEENQDDTIKNLNCNTFGQAVNRQVLYLLAENRGFFFHSIKKEI